MVAMWCKENTVVTALRRVISSVAPRVWGNESEKPDVRYGALWEAKYAPFARILRAFPARSSHPCRWFPIVSKRTSGQFATFCKDQSPISWPEPHHARLALTAARYEAWYLDELKTNRLPIQNQRSRESWRFSAYCRVSTLQSQPLENTASSSQDVPAPKLYLCQGNGDAPSP